MDEIVYEMVFREDQRFVHQCQSSYLSSFFESWPTKLL